MRARYVGNRSVKNYRFQKKVYAFEKNKWVNIEWADLFAELTRYPDVFETELGFDLKRFKEFSKIKNKIRFEGNLIKTEDPAAIKRLNASAFVKPISKLGRRGITHVFRIINYVDPEYLELIGEESKTDIGIVRRLPGWGDVNMVLASLPGFKIRYPKSKITFSCPDHLLPLAENNPHLDSIVPLKKFDTFAHFDAIVDLTDPCIRNEIKTQPKVEKNRIEVFAEHLNCRLVQPTREIYLTEEEILEADKEDLGEGPIIGLVPKSYAPVRNWGNFRALSQYIHERLPRATVIIFSGENCWEPGSWEKQYIGVPIRKILALLNRCDIVVGPDTGPMHSASQLGVPTVWVFTHIDGSVRTKNYEKVRVVQDKGSCPQCPCWYTIPCSKKARKDKEAGVRCSSAIKISHVFGAINEQLSFQDSPYDRRAQQLHKLKSVQGKITNIIEDKPPLNRIKLEDAAILSAKSELSSKGLGNEVYKVGIVQGVAPSEVLDYFIKNLSEKVILFDRFGVVEDPSNYAYVCRRKDSIPILNECDIVIGAESPLLFSAAALGIPTIWLTVNDRLIKPYYDAYTLPEVNTEKLKEVYEEVREVPTVSYVVVCYNCYETTKISMDAIFNFRKASHEVVLVDNDSNDWTKMWGPKESRLRYFRLDKNYGCIIGRNKGLREARGKWIFILDNDQFISPNSFNALLNVQADISGVEAWSMDRGAWAHDIKENRGPLAYVGGGGVLLRHDTLKDVGYLDERYAPAWFSDPDFCFTARKKGYSIGYATDHGIHHEPHKTVFSQKTFDHNAAWRASHKKFKEKWNHELQYGDFLERAKDQRQVRKPKILLCCDVPGWAWWYKAHILKKYLSDEFDFEIICLDKKSFDGKDKYDLYFTFGFLYVDRLNAIPKDRKMTGITAIRPVAQFRPKIKKAFAVHANSVQLFDMLNEIHDRCYYVPNGVDPEIFKPDRLAAQYPFTIAHVGKPVPEKGYDQVIKPIMERLKDVRLKSHRKGYNNAKPQNEMVPFYQDIDILIVSSTIDGTPNPALEAAACGKTIISNPIGNMPQFIKDGMNGFLVPGEPNGSANLKGFRIEDYLAKIELLKQNRTRCTKMGQEARKTVLEGWSWKIQVERYRNMFREVIYG